MNIKVTTYITFVALVLIISSCAAPTYLSKPQIDYPYIENTYNLGVQNMDNDAKVETANLVCHYDSFDIKFKMTDGFVVIFEITNKTNKSMIIDKSKCYVLYDGYATELFKDVRSSRSTTFNNVQDAVNNVQTNEAGVSMTIPPYAKWAVKIKETNLRKMVKLPEFVEEPGITHLTQYDDIDITEFVIPYSFDYSMAKWSTCRNRVFINNIVAEKTTKPSKNYDENVFFDKKGLFYYKYRPDLKTPVNYSEANRIDDINIAMYKKHRRKVILSHWLWSPVTIIGFMPFHLILGCFPEYADSASESLGCHHYPTIYGNKYVQKERGRAKIRKDYTGDYDYKAWE